MKNFITFLIVVLAFSTVAPSISFANGIDSNELSLNVSNQLETGLNVILDTDELVIFQLKESDGNTYEYVEKVTVLEDNTELLTQEKYLVSSDMSKQCKSEFKPRIFSRSTFRYYYGINLREVFSYANEQSVNRSSLSGTNSIQTIYGSCSFKTHLRYTS